MSTVEKKTTTETSTTGTSDRDLMKGPVRTRQQSITADTAAFLGVPAGKVFDVLRGVWTVTKGQPPLTDQELMVGMAIVARYELDPFAREIYVTRDKKGRLMTIIGVDGWIRILDRTEHYDGLEQIEEEDKDGNLLSVETTIYSKKRSHPARYKARMDEYMRLGGFMIDKIPRHMLGVFSLRHAGRLFVPMGTVVTEEEARYMQADAEPAKTLDDLTKEMETPVTETDPPATETEPEVNPPTADEVKADQAQLADEFADELGKADTASRVEELSKGIGEALSAGTFTHRQAAQLELLANAAKERLSKVTS